MVTVAPVLFEEDEEHLPHALRFVARGFTGHIGYLYPRRGLKRAVAGVQG
jgi:hypothetical protein